MYRDDLWDDVSQGDIFSSFSLSDYAFGVNGTATFASPRVGPAVLLSNDCDYDNKKFVMLAELLPLEKLVGPDDRDKVRHYQTRRLFYYSSFKNLLPESCIDFCRIHRIDKKFISECYDIHPRLASLSEDGCLALRHRIGVFFGLPEDV